MYAMYIYVTGISAMFGFADLGLGVVVGRNISVALGKNDLAAVRRYWGTGNLIVLPMLCLVTLGFVCLTVWLGPLWFDQLAPANVGLFRICLVINGLGLFFAYYGTFWLAASQAYLDFKFLGLIRAFISPLQIIPAVILAAYTHNPFWVLACNSAVALLQLVIVIRHAGRHYSLGLCLEAATLGCAREMAGFTAKMIGALATGAVFGPMLPNLLGKLAPTATMVPFGLAYKIASQLQGLSTSVMGPVLHNTARVAGDGRSAAAKIYNHVFTFMFEWYLLAALWLGLWHPVLLRLYLVHSMGFRLGQQTALVMGPLLIPLMTACSLTSMANLSTAQLTSLNRLGTTVGFSIAAGVLSVAGVLIGWSMARVTGAVYGFLFSRIALVAQDLYTQRLIGAGGWLDSRTWLKIAGQSCVAAVFALACLRTERSSYWLLIPAALHGALVAAWILRQPLRKFLADSGWLPLAAQII
jgi:hypothetical protein